MDHAGTKVNRMAGALLALLGMAVSGAVSGPDRVSEIVQRSVQNINIDWLAAPAYDFKERDVITARDQRSVKTYEVLMIDGSPYKKLIADNGQPLPAGQASSEELKLQQEMARRRNETPRARHKRVAEYQRERRQDNALMREMVRAFDFKLAGEETLTGRRCFVVEASPRPDYVPRSRETKVLKGMRGKMWIDEGQYQWVKVHAEVFLPVAFGLFIAHAEPGTEFTLEQQPVEGNLWLPSHFSVRVNASILFWSRRSWDDETYSEYRSAGEGDEARRAQ